MINQTSSIFAGTLYECQCFKEWTIFIFIGLIGVIIIHHALKVMFPINQNKYQEEKKE